MPIKMAVGLSPEQHLHKTLGWIKQGWNLDVGIDPGASGALGFQVTGNGEVCRYHVQDIPTFKVSRTGKTKSGKGKTKTVPDNAAIIAIFKPFEKYAERVRVCLEMGVVQVKGRGASAYNGFRVGCNYGCWPLFLQSLGFRLHVVMPGVWKKEFKLAGKEKEDSRQLALQWFPKADLQNKGHHDRAEALLLADYGRRVFDGFVKEESEDVWPAE